jgi:two-component system response regulator YesN
LYRIIIADDEILARVGIKSLIPWREHGYELIGECENGKKAYDMAKELLPDIIVTDIKMPVMNGIELIRALKAENKDIKFIVLSSYDDFEYVKEAMKLGAEDYILKLQMEPEGLLKVLQNVCNKIVQEKNEKRRKNDNMPLMQEKFLKDLIFGKPGVSGCSY